MHSAPIVQQSIRIEEPAGYRIIIPGLEIVEPCLLIVVIPPVAEGVILAQGILQASRYAYHLAPAIVHIADNLCPVFVRQGDYVPKDNIQSGIEPKIDSITKKNPTKIDTPIINAIIKTMTLTKALTIFLDLYFSGTNFINKKTKIS